MGCMDKGAEKVIPVFESLASQRSFRDVTRAVVCVFAIGLFVHFSLYGQGGGYYQSRWSLEWCRV